MTANLEWGRVGLLTAASGAMWILMAAGCGEKPVPMGTAKGVVMFKGVPVKEGVVWIYNKDTAYSNQAEIHDGKFDLPGEIRTGEYTVYVTSIPPAPGSPFDPVKMIGTGDFPEGIPMKYQLESESDLKMEIKEGVSEVTIEIPEE